MRLHIVGENLMVYCTKCGTKNEDEAKVCVNCGATLVTGGSTNWFLFIGGLIMSIGLAIMVRSLAVIFSRSA